MKNNEFATVPERYGRVCISSIKTSTHKGREILKFIEQPFNFIV